MSRWEWNPWGSIFSVPKLQMSPFLLRVTANNGQDGAGGKQPDRQETGYYYWVNQRQVLYGEATGHVSYLGTRREQEQAQVAVVVVFADGLGRYLPTYNEDAIQPGPCRSARVGTTHVPHGDGRGTHQGPGEWDMLDQLAPGSRCDRVLGRHNKSRRMQQADAK